ncbi:Solute carrier family 35 member F6 [Toxocara canis]|uniref:Solute carrier family 35 member F6 n=1 Tax=Toxocara canis TaxID=6265 RepID=A0A0B2VWS3_TOXCA|nr:Solute carrier family 35 member F6 [Toxocara canis]
MSDDTNASEKVESKVPSDEPKVSMEPNAQFEKKVSVARDGKSLDESRKSGLDPDLEKKRKSAPIMAAVDKPPKKIFLIFLAVLLVVTGSVNTIAAKWANRTSIDGRYFNHPFFQATVMFVGEMCCMVAYVITLLVQRYRWKRRHANDPPHVHSSLDMDPNKKRESQISECSQCESVTTEQSCCEVRSCDSCASQIPTVPRFNWLLFAAPAICDVVATSVQYIGLVLTSAASYQMLRGAVIIFTGLMSIVFLRMRLEAYRWAGMITVVVGLVIVGVADVVFTEETTTSTTTDIIIGIRLTASWKDQRTRIDRRSWEARTFLQVAHTSRIAFFNFAGVSVTKYMSATTRMVLDSVRTIIIWAVSIPLFDSQFIPLQILGFVFLVAGMFIYNDILFMPYFRKTRVSYGMLDWRPSAEAPSKTFFI